MFWCRLHILWTYFRWMAKDQGYFLGGSDVSILTYFSFLKHKTREDIVDLSAWKNLLLKNSRIFIILLHSNNLLSSNFIAIYSRYVINRTPFWSLLKIILTNVWLWFLFRFFCILNSILLLFFSLRLVLFNSWKSEKIFEWQ